MRLPSWIAITIALLGGLALSACAAKPPVPMVSAPATVVQAPDPAVVHRIWEDGYEAGYRAAERLASRRDQQEQDQLSNVPAGIAGPTEAPPAQTSPVAAVPEQSGFVPLGPATPVSAGN